MHKLAPFLLTLFILTACNTPDLQASPTPTVPDATKTPAATEMPLPTSTSLPTDTPIPTETPTEEPTPTPEPVGLEIRDGKVYQWDGGIYDTEVMDKWGRAHIRADELRQTEQGTIAVVVDKKTSGQGDPVEIIRAKAMVDEEGQLHIFKDGSLVKVGDQWYRYMSDTNELVEWDILQPAVEREFTGVVKKSNGEEIEFTLNIGLMPDIVESEGTAITDILENPEYPQGVNKVVDFFLRTCWINYKRYTGENISWDNYLDEVMAGRGEIEVAVSENGEWNGSMATGYRIVQVSPQDIVFRFSSRVHNKKDLAVEAYGVGGEVLLFQSFSEQYIHSREGVYIEKWMQYGINMNGTFSKMFSSLLFFNEASEVVENGYYNLVIALMSDENYSGFLRISPKTVEIERYPWFKIEWSE